VSNPSSNKNANRFNHNAIHAGYVYYLLTKLRANAASGIGLSSITAAELHFGTAKTHSEKNAKALDEFLASLDAHIAAHARQLGVIFVTNNVREFVRVEGLRLENWAAES
jgi:tRNA(fMet)-specific endonuclease VapC